MIDVLFVLLLVGLFAATAGFVAVCDRLVGPDDETFGGAIAEGVEPVRKVAA